jgi:hypothetical protein
MIQKIELGCLLEKVELLLFYHYRKDPE